MSSASASNAAKKPAKAPKTGTGPPKREKAPKRPEKAPKTPKSLVDVLAGDFLITGETPPSTAEETRAATRADLAGSNGSAPPARRAARIPKDTPAEIEAAPAGANGGRRPRRVYSDEQQAARRASLLLKHASDPTRLGVLLALDAAPLNVGALAARQSITQPALSHHLALLRHGGIVEVQRDGKMNFYELTETGRKLVDAVKSLA